MIEELLTRDHDRKSFECGISEINDFLRRYARQNAEKGIVKLVSEVRSFAADKLLSRAPNTPVTETFKPLIEALDNAAPRRGKPSDGGLIIAAKALLEKLNDTRKDIREKVQTASGGKSQTASIDYVSQYDFLDLVTAWALAKVASRKDTLIPKVNHPLMTAYESLVSDFRETLGIDYRGADDRGVLWSEEKAEFLEGLTGEILPKFDLDLRSALDAWSKEARRGDPRRAAELLRLTEKALDIVSEYIQRVGRLKRLPAAKRQQFDFLVKRVLASISAALPA